MPPAANPRRTRRVTLAEEVPDIAQYDPEAAAAEPEQDDAVSGTPVKTRRKPRSDLRRAQTAVIDDKVRVPRGKRAAETPAGDLMAPIRGRYFKLSKSVGLMPLMEWAAAREEVDASNVAQLLGFYRVLQDIVDPSDWLEFKQFCREEKCSDQDMIAFQNAAFEAIAAYPTEEPAAS